MDYSRHIGRAAKLHFGQPSSATKTELRFGTHGSKSVDLIKGTWFDHEAGEGGGVLDLLKLHFGNDNKAIDDFLGNDRGYVENPNYSNVKAPDKFRFIEQYEYKNVQGQTTYVVERWENGSSKRFKQKAVVDGQKQPTLNGVAPSLYRLPELLLKKDEPVFIVEGERCVHAAESLGLLATTASGGAGRWHDEFAQYLKGREVTILPDNDEAGQNHANKVKSALVGVAKLVQVVNLPNLPAKGDIVDFIRMGGTASKIQQAINPWISVKELLDLEINVKPQPHEWIPSGFTLLAGKPKAGKSYLTEYLALEIAKTKPVFYLALEYNDLVAQKRFSNVKNEAIDNLALIVGDRCPRWDKGGKELICRYLDFKKPEIIFIDTLGRLKPPAATQGYEAETEALNSIKNVIDKYETNCVVLHHTRKDSVHDEDTSWEDKILGSTALAGVPDNIMVMQRDYNAGDDISRLRGRGRLLEREIDLSLHCDVVNRTFEETDGRIAKLRRIAPVQAEIANALQNSQGLRIGEIAIAINKPQSQISQAVKSMVSKGDLDTIGEGKTYIWPDENRGIL